ncbi:MAG: hypothetical protein LBD06_00900 [Candidatus Accumulibacter sp.]|nr:hypothetical protein [Accumulibacter sp.]
MNTGLSRLYGRVIEAVPDTRFHRMAILFPIRRDGTTITLVFEGALDGDIFRADVTRCLAPSLKPGDIVVMDKLPNRQASGVRSH